MEREDRGRGRKRPVDRRVQRRPGRLIAAALVAAACIGAARAQEAEEGYFRRHAWHWVAAFGLSLLDNEYEDRVGVSTHPLLFSDPPGIDRRVRDSFADRRPSRGYLYRNKLTTNLALGAGTILIAHLGRERAGRRIADDATGLLEVWFFDNGASGLVKNITGRERPELEYIDERNLDPARRAEEEASRSNRRSFYSGGTSQRFALMSYMDAVAATRIRSRWARAASFAGFYGLAALTGVRQLERDKHYFTDVVVGAAAGTLIGRKFHALHAGGSRRPHAAHLDDPPPGWRLQSLSFHEKGFAAVAAFSF